jgi:hypothetical protein
MSDSDESRFGATSAEDVGSDGADGNTDRPPGDGADPDAFDPDAATDATPTEDADAASPVEELNPLFREPIEPEAPSAENALFVFLGVLGTVGLLASAVPGVL